MHKPSKKTDERQCQNALYPAYSNDYYAYNFKKDLKYEVKPDAHSPQYLIAITDQTVVAKIIIDKFHKNQGDNRLFIYPDIGLSLTFIAEDEQPM